jgi:NuA3 HAT complex component NTO1
MTYNTVESPFHRTAKRIKVNAQPLLEELDALSSLSRLSPPDEPDHPDHPDVPGRTVGDLEPSLLLLRALTQVDRGDETRDMLHSIFAFEMEKPKELTPPPPSPKKRRDRSHAERKKMWEEREARAKERLSTGRPTRASQAATRAFAEEAGLPIAATREAEASSQPESASVQPTARSRRRSTRIPVSADGGDEQSISTSNGEMRRQGKSQVGVAGIETITVLSDRERREAERALDLNAQEIDGQDLFKRFNVGWVLPEGSKRRRAERPESQKQIREWFPPRAFELVSKG